MNYLTRPFWSVIPHDSKMDVLVETAHTHLIYAALRDKETDIIRSADGTYTLYGKQDALLVIPRLLCTHLLLGFYGALKRT